MRVYSVFEPPVLPGSLEDDAQSLVFVRHGWSLAALLVPLIWLVVRRLWWLLALYVGAVIVIQLLSYAVSPVITAGLSVALALILMVEAGQARLEYMSLRGYREIAILEARNKKEAEQRFFEHWLAARDQLPPRTALPSARPHVLRPSSATPPALPGLPG